MQKITLFSLLIVVSFLTSCGDKQTWSIAEPILIINPKVKQPHINKIKNAKTQTSKKNTIPHILSFSQFKYFLDFSDKKFSNLYLNLKSQLHFQTKDVGLNLKVTSLCAFVKTNQLTHITHITEIKVKNKLSFINFLPEEVLNITQKSLIKKDLQCNFKFTVINKDGDNHTFRLNQKMVNIINTDISLSDVSLNLFKAEYRKTLKEKKLSSNKYLSSKFLQFKEKNLDEIYINSLNMSETLAIQCQNNELNNELSYSANLNNKNKQHVFLSDIINTKDLKRHDVSKNTNCRVIKYDKYNNIVKISPMFLISLDNITYTKNRTYESDPCDSRTGKPFSISCQNSK
ncbi:MAG: hypothetical protein HAW60_05775 [Bdellovibrionales bacterium]|nr:hypothetical protein [Bdellovibrionales bacterium]